MGGYLNTRQNCFVPLRSADVTADDTALDPTLSGYTPWDFSDRDFFALQPGDNGLQVYFAGEGDDTDYFGCRIWGQAPYGPGLRLAEISGHFGSGLAPDDGSITVDTTTHKVAETILLDNTNNFGTRTVLLADCSVNFPATLDFDVMGLGRVYFEFYNVGDTTEVHRIRPYGRTW